MDILTFSENDALSLELVAAASALAQGTGARVRPISFDGLGNGAAAIGGASPLVVKTDGPSSDFRDPELAGDAISALVEPRRPCIVLIGSTKFGRMVAGRLSVLSRIPVLAEVSGLSLDASGSLSGSRPVYAGKFVATVSAPTPCVALVPLGAYARPQAGAAGQEAQPEVAIVRVRAARSRRTETKSGEKAAFDLRSAKVIVSAGRGFRKKEDLALAEKLAVALKGVMGASRPLSSDLGWLGEEYHIGLTGVYVHPDLYVAVGISGQLQHVAGIRDSKVIVAINKDKQAPIFQVADYGVVGDLYEVIPALLRALGAPT